MEDDIFKKGLQAYFEEKGYDDKNEQFVEVLSELFDRMHNADVSLSNVTCTEVSELNNKYIVYLSIPGDEDSKLITINKSNANSITDAVVAAKQKLVDYYEQEVGEDG